MDGLEFDSFRLNCVREYKLIFLSVPLQNSAKNAWICNVFEGKGPYPLDQCTICRWELADPLWPIHVG